MSSTYLAIPNKQHCHCCHHHHYYYHHQHHYSLATLAHYTFSIFVPHIFHPVYCRNSSRQSSRTKLFGSSKPYQLFAHGHMALLIFEIRVYRLTTEFNECSLWVFHLIYCEPSRKIIRATHNISRAFEISRHKKR